MGDPSWCQKQLPPNRPTPLAQTTVKTICPAALVCPANERKLFKRFAGGGEMTSMKSRGQPRLGEGQGSQSRGTLPSLSGPGQRLPLQYQLPRSLPATNLAAARGSVSACRKGQGAARGSVSACQKERGAARGSASVSPSPQQFPGCPPSLKRFEEEWGDVERCTLIPWQPQGSYAWFPPPGSSRCESCVALPGDGGLGSFDLPLYPRSPSAGGGMTPPRAPQQRGPRAEG